MSVEIPVEVPAELEPLLPGFLASRQRELVELDQALLGADFSRVKFIGHNMKGVGGGYGFDQVTELGERFERTASAEDLTATSECLADYRDFLACMRVVLI